MEFIGYIASFLMGIVLGLMGGGGSILTVPILVYLFGLSPTIATGYSLFVVGTTALIGGAMYVRKGDVDLRVGLFFALPSVIGVNIARAWIVPSIPTEIWRWGDFVVTKDILVMVTFASLMIMASRSMIRGRRETKPTILTSFQRFALIALEGLGVGVAAGFVGAGGGFLIIPALVLLAGLSMRVAVGTSLMIIAFQSLLGFAGDALRGVYIDWTFLILLSALAAGGIIAGSMFAHKVKEQKLKVAFGWFVLVMGASILFEQIRNL